MHRIERIVDAAQSARIRPMFIGLRACGSYQSLTLGDTLSRQKRIYDQHGALVALLETSDVVEPSCGRTPEEATVHYGQHVDCVET